MATLIADLDASGEGVVQLEVVRLEVVQLEEALRPMIGEDQATLVDRIVAAKAIQRVSKAITRSATLTTEPRNRLTLFQKKLLLRSTIRSAKSDGPRRANQLVMSRDRSVRP